MQSYTGNLYC